MWAQNTTIPGYNGFLKGRQLSLHLPDMDLLEKKSHRLITFRLKTQEEILEILVNKWTATENLPYIGLLEIIPGNKILKRN